MNNQAYYYARIGADLLEDLQSKSVDFSVMLTGKNKIKIKEPFSNYSSILKTIKN